jgi:serine/threonine-protein kinase
MNEPHDPSLTADVSSVPHDSLDAGLAAGFGRPADVPGSVLSELRSSLGPLRPVLLREAEGESAHVVKPNSDAMPATEETGDRYQLQGEIARGGMGAVLRGRDVDLGRDLAIKVLLEKHAHRPDVARRFIEEAQISGQLQHPGVVPVYDIGHFGQRPFFTMKLVKGKTLAALLGERTDPVADRPRLLGIALQVAQTVAYAHAKGVIHRDLKPGNVMVGAFGEVQVMDWGLAKVMAEGGMADEERACRQQPEEGTMIRTARISAPVSGTDTETGSLLGTPAYMPPEQAQGDVAHLDRRADVFGLGAILCEILTGKPPYVGRSSEELRRQACNGDLADATARLGACGADAELIVLTRNCLAAEAFDRPKDAQAVADGLSAYLTGVQERLHQAELAEVEARARAGEEARRRRLTLALAGTVLLALTLGGSAWLWVKSDRDTRQAQRTRDVNDALNKAMALREQAKAAPVGGAALLAQAREQVQRALALVENGSADATLVQQVTLLQTELNEEEKDRTLIAALDEARLAQAESAAGENRFARERAVPLFRKAFAAYGLAAGQGEPVAAADRLRRRPSAVRQAAVAALDEWADLGVSPRFGLAEPHHAWLVAVAEAAEPVDGWARQFRAARAEKDPVKQRVALQKLARTADLPRLPARALTALGLRLWMVGDMAGAVQLLRRAQRQHPTDFWVNHDLGMALRFAQPPQLTEAVRYLSAAVALRPDSPGTLHDLGAALHANGQAEEAIACHYKAMELDSKLAAAHNNLGTALAAKGRMDEAIQCYRKAVEIDPNVASFHTNLGAALFDKGKVNEAIACCRKAIALDRRNAFAHYNLGYFLHDKGKVDEAIACYHKAIALDPMYATAHTNLGFALKSKGQLDDAIACLEKAIALDPKSAAAHSILDSAHARKGELDEAIAYCRKAIDLDPKYTEAHCNLGAALADKGQVDEAIACYHKAIDLDPKSVQAHYNLGNALQRKGRLDEAIASYQKAIALDPKSAQAHGNLGSALKAKGKLDEAIACYQKSIELAPKDALAHTNLGNALFAKGRLDKAIACYQKAIELDPKDTLAHTNLGGLWSRLGQWDEAIACFQRAIALGAKSATAHAGLGLALFGKGQVDEAIACYQKAIALEPKDAKTHGNLGIARYRKGQMDEAIACFQKAIALDAKLATAHAGLGLALLAKGRCAEARDALLQARSLLPANHPLQPTIASQLQEAQRLLHLDAKLAAYFKDDVKVKDARQALELARECRAAKFERGAARLYAAAFAADPTLAADPNAGHRYQAACAASLAAAGQGIDAGQLDENERARLRHQALAWLRADLAAWRKYRERSLLLAGAVLRSALERWQQDDALTGLRDAAALARLPAAERAAFMQLWADVAALLQKAETPATKESKR